jgi:hypothetical protein
MRSENSKVKMRPLYTLFDFNFYKKIEENSSMKELIKDNLFEDVFKRSTEAQL